MREVWRSGAGLVLELDANTKRALSGVPGVALAMSMAITSGAQTQTPACDDLKATLAARFESNGVRGSSLEAVPVSAPTPADARVIGNCESGAYKILYRRWGAAGATSAAATPLAKADEPAAPVRQASGASSERVSRAPAASAAGSTPRPAVRTADAALANCSTITVPPPVASGNAPNTWPAWAGRGVDFAAAHWPWIGVLLLLLPLAGWIWRAYLSPCDKDGLPRGPRL